MWGWIKNGRNYMRMRKDGCEDELRMEESMRMRKGECVNTWRIEETIWEWERTNVWIHKEWKKKYYNEEGWMCEYRKNGWKYMRMRKDECVNTERIDESRWVGGRMNVWIHEEWMKVYENEEGRMCEYMKNGWKYMRMRKDECVNTEWMKVYENEEGCMCEYRKNGWKYMRMWKDECVIESILEQI